MRKAAVDGEREGAGLIAPLSVSFIAPCITPSGDVPGEVANMTVPSPLEHRPCR